MSIAIDSLPAQEHIRPLLVADSQPIGWATDVAVAVLAGALDLILAECADHCRCYGCRGLRIVTVSPSRPY